MGDSAVNLGAGGTDFSGMSMDEMLFGASDPAAAYRATRPSYDEFGQGYDYRDGQFQPAVDEEGYNLEIMNPSRSAAIQGREFEQEYGRADPYGGLAEPARRRGFSEATELYLQDGGNPAVEEAGIMSALFDPRIDLPSSKEQGLVRESARTGSEGAAMYYPEGSPTFEQVLEDQYGYPDVEREIYGASTTAQMRAERPRHDMPTYQELEDARAHALQTALLARDMGPETATKVGGLGEMFDRYMPILGTATDADVVMDKRNNAFGAQLLAKAGIDATPQQLTKMVDQAVFDQLDVVLGREPGERRFKSPDTGIDIFFPRDAQGFFDINRYD